MIFMQDSPDHSFTFDEVTSSMVSVIALIFILSFCVTKTQIQSMLKSSSSSSLLMQIWRILYLL